MRLQSMFLEQCTVRSQTQDALTCVCLQPASLTSAISLTTTSIAPKVCVQQALILWL